MVWPLLGGIAAGALGLIGGMQANSANAKQAAQQIDFQGAQAEQQMEFGREMAGRQEDFQKESIANQEDFQRESVNSAQQYATQMSNTSYQRGMADMRAAGLNPMLAYGQGGATAPQSAAPSGASSSGATASVSAMPGAKAQIQDALSPAITRAFQGYQAAAQLDQIQAQTSLLGAQTTNTAQLTRSGEASEALDRARTITEARRPDLLRAQYATELRRPGLVSAQAQSAQATAGQVERENDRFDSWGPRTTLGDTLASGEAMARRAARAGNLGQLSVPGLPENNYSGPRQIPDFWGRLRNLFRGGAGGAEYGLE